MSAPSNLFEVVPTTIGLHPAHVETFIAEFSIHRFFHAASFDERHASAGRRVMR
jgi:hypothetical protein